MMADIDHYKKRHSGSLQDFHKLHHPAICRYRYIILVVQYFILLGMFILVSPCMVSICCNFARNLYLFEFALDFLTNGKTMITIPYVLVNEVPLGLERANIPVPLSKSYQRKNCCFKVLCRRFFDQKTNPTNSAFFSVVLAFFGLFDEFRRIPTQGSALKPLHFHANHVFSKHSMEEKRENLEKTKSKTKKHSPDRKVARGILAKPLVFF